MGNDLTYNYHRMKIGKELQKQNYTSCLKIISLSLSRYFNQIWIFHLLFQDQNGKKIKTESGVWIPASYKSDRYAKWVERSKVSQMQEEDQDGDEPNSKKSKIYCRGDLNAGLVWYTNCRKPLGFQDGFHSALIFETLLKKLTIIGMVYLVM